MAKECGNYYVQNVPKDVVGWVGYTGYPCTISSDFRPEVQSSLNEHPCSSANVLDNERRDVTCTYKQDQLCDDLISTTWYRIEGSVVTTCPGTSSCGSLYPIWLNVTRGNITESVEGSANVKKKEEEGTSENDTWKFVAFGCIGVLVLAVLMLSIVFVIIRRRREKQTKPTKNDSIREVIHFENEEHYDEIGNVPNSALEGHTEKGNVYSTIDGDTNIASNQTSSNAFDRAVDESRKNQCYTNMLKQSAQNTRQTDTSDLKKKINFAFRPSTDNGIERESKEYDDFEIDTNDSVDLKEININSSGVEKENERSNNQYQTLQEHCQYEGMAEEHAYQHLKKDHQYESLSKGK
ncbi:hypothetical protein FSP39_011434 [Pinctada imbricata]|uniref:Uncharacterized protein n=1 Tax=Pinctada imbricata TaxID=66713 RepID=A0AA89C1G6_PINIB|nr:hypothetical protein FSP39_011434 [Pinctada imbricata]